MGRFTLRDEGQTIAVGKITKYKPYVKGIVGASTTSGSNAAASTAQQTAPVTINSNVTEELIYDPETGETRPKEKQLDGIAEGNEDDEGDN